MIFLLLLLATCLGGGAAREPLGISSVQVSSRYNSNTHNKSACCDPDFVLDGYMDTYWLTLPHPSTTHWLMVTLERPTKVVRKVVIGNLITDGDIASRRINNTKV